MRELGTSELSVLHPTQVGLSIQSNDRSQDCSTRDLWNFSSILHSLSLSCSSYSEFGESYILRAVQWVTMTINTDASHHPIIPSSVRVLHIKGFEGSPQYIFLKETHFSPHLAILPGLNWTRNITSYLVSSKDKGMLAQLEWMNFPKEMEYVPQHRKDWHAQFKFPLCSKYTTLRGHDIIGRAAITIETETNLRENIIQIIEQNIIYIYIL